MRFFCAFVLCLLAGTDATHAAASCNREIGRGIASWYGPGFEGRLTKSEEVFDPSGLSAAHASLPFGTIVKVTNMRTAKSVNVRINDRGAFENAVIDLSEEAARRIGMVEAGLAAVSLHQCE